MDKRLAVIFITSMVLALGAPSVSQAAVALQQRPPDVSGPPQLPRPIDPSMNIITIVTPTIQLVGFTHEILDGVRGVLNYTLACQAEFPHSRMCTADQIRQTLIVPDAPGIGYAWVEDSSQAEVANCRGWASASNSDSGTAIDLSVLYGAKVSRGCNQSLRIACCAMVQP